MHRGQLAAESMPTDGLPTMPSKWHARIDARIGGGTIIVSEPPRPETLLQRTRRLAEAAARQALMEEVEHDFQAVQGRLLIAATLRAGSSSAGDVAAAQDAPRPVGHPGGLVARSFIARSHLPLRVRVIR